jgi:UPF0716 protein FxsA
MSSAVPPPRPGRRPRRRRWVWWLLAVLFVVVPLVEIYLLVQLGQAIGAWWTILVLIADGILGSLLVKREGGRAWGALQDALASHRMPATELADGALILIGGTLLLTPGFLSDVLGLFCILPFTRPLARRVLARVLTRQLSQRLSPVAPASPGPWSSRPGTSRPGTGRPESSRPGNSQVVRGEVVDDDPFGPRS